MKLADKTKQTAEECVAAIAAAYAEFPWDNTLVYANWLAQTYHYVRHATRLLALAAARCRLDQEVLHTICLKGIREEGGHEELAARDVAALGLELTTFGELAETAAYHQTLFYGIDHDGPVALTGYFLPLEGLAARHLRHDLPRIMALHPPKATTFLKVHCQLDVGHYDDGLRSLDGMTEPELNAVTRNLVLSTALYIRMVEAIRRRANGQSRKAA